MPPLQLRTRSAVRARRVFETQVASRTRRTSAGIEGASALARRATHFRGHEGRVDEFSLFVAEQLPEVRRHGIHARLQAQGEDVQKMRRNLEPASAPIVKGL